jgi:hypothetical protein
MQSSCGDFKMKFSLSLIFFTFVGLLVETYHFCVLVSRSQPLYPFTISISNLSRMTRAIHSQPAPLLTHSHVNICFPNSFSTCRSSDDHSPGYDRTSFYDRVSTSQIGSRNSDTSTEFIRRNSYHSNDRGRQRDRQHFRNSPYSLIVDR